MIGKLNWSLCLRKRKNLIIRLSPVTTKSAKDIPVIASFSIRVISGCKALDHQEIRDKQLKLFEDFVWMTEIPSTGRFIIEVEFLDLKTESPNGGEFHSIWSEGITHKYPSITAQSSLGRMLLENIYSDIIICASNGTIYWGSPGSPCSSFIGLS